MEPPEGLSNYYYEKQFILDWGVQNTLNNQQQSSSSRSSSSSTTKTNNKDATKVKNKCKLCQKSIAQDNMRGHIGFHILRKKNVIGEVCGFCGLPSCIAKSKLTDTNKSKGEQYYKLDSSCVYFYSYGRRPVYSKRVKCTNYLARCKAVGCKADIWKYHMEEHYRQCHPLLKLPELFLVSDDERKTIDKFQNE